MPELTSPFLVLCALWLLGVGALLAAAMSTKTFEHWRHRRRIKRLLERHASHPRSLDGP